MSAPPPPPPPPPPSQSFFSTILSRPGAVASASVGWLLAAAGYNGSQTAAIASNPDVAEAAITAAGNSSVQTPAQQLQAVVESEEVQTAMATAAAGINSSSSSAAGGSAPPMGIVARKKAELAQAAQAAKDKSSSASKNREAECLRQFGTKHTVTVGGGGGSSGANATSSISTYKPKGIGNVWTAVIKQVQSESPKAELTALEKQLSDAIRAFTTGNVSHDKEITRLEKLVEAKRAEYYASKKSRTRRSRQRRAQRKTRRSRR